MNKQIDREALEAALLEAIDNNTDAGASPDEYAIRCFFGLDPSSITPEEAYRSMMNALMDAAIAELAHGDGRVITDRDTKEIATGDFSNQSGDVEPADTPL